MTENAGKNNKQKIQETLNEAYGKLTEAIDMSLQDISSNPDSEKEYIAIWGDYTTKISSYFMQQSEKTGNEHVGKNIIKYFMFNR